MSVFNSVLLVVLLVHASYAACPSATYVDSYSSLPASPTFPTTTLSSALTPNPAVLVQNHWSETANLTKYRPPKVIPVSNPVQTACPHLQSGLKLWHNPSTWSSGVVPTSGDITIPAGVSVLISSCSIDPTVVLGVITVPPTSTLILADAIISIKAKGFIVQGSLLGGSATCRLRNKITITLYGTRGAQALPAAPSVKGIDVTGTIDLHGVQYTPTWSRLATTANKDASYIFIQDLVNWQPGQRIVITTTELKDARDWHRNEERTIVSVQLTTLGAAVTAIQLDTPLSYRHFGGLEYQAEVSLTSRNILIQGDPDNSDPTDTANSTCVGPNDQSTYPCENSYLTGFGAHIFVNGVTATGRFSGVELFRAGQTNVLGRYPIHFHMMGDLTSSNYSRAYVRDSSVHKSFFRCYAIHGTSGALLTQNTAYDAIGHCYFLEDGVEESNIFSYNQAAFVHPLGQYFYPSTSMDGWYGQNLLWYTATPNLILPSDMAAGCFYITNTYNDFIGNAASGGFAGFSVPTLTLPVKLHNNITNMSPGNRPFRAPFAGNSGHSSGYWWQSAGSLYVGGQLKDVGGVLSYTTGRSASRDTCSDKTAGTPAGSGGCYDVTKMLWLRFEDNKVFLSNRGMQNWGNRAEIIRLELHDVSLAMNVFGQVWIDNMLMECRTANNVPTWFGGCPAATVDGASVPWGKCNVRDFTFFSGFGGFQWYDVGQRHILTNSIFRNCRADWNKCTYGTAGKCNNVAVFTSLTHSDQFVPEMMQVTSGIQYQNVSDLWRFTTKLTDSTGATVSGKLQSWYDPDGSASQLGSRAMIGSAWSNDWWKYNSGCQNYIQAWRCKLASLDSAASLVIKHNPTLEARIGTDLCMNGGGKYPCTVVAQASHFGTTNETAGLAVGVNAKITGPIIAANGGWFIRFAAGTPKTLSFVSVEVSMSDVLLLALPYPTGTTFSIYNKGASWCSTSWAVCRHNYTSVSSIAQVASAFGDAYYWNNAARTLYLRVVSTPESYGSPGKDPLVWSPFYLNNNFTRGGRTLIAPAATSIVIESSCATDPCAPQPTVVIPPAFPRV